MATKLARGNSVQFHASSSTNISISIPLAPSHEYHEHCQVSVYTFTFVSSYLIFHLRFLVIFLLNCRERGWRSTGDVSPCMDPCSVCLEESCTVVAEGNNSFFFLFAWILPRENLLTFYSPIQDATMSFAQDAHSTFAQLTARHLLHRAHLAPSLAHSAEPQLFPSPRLLLQARWETYLDAAYH